MRGCLSCRSGRVSFHSKQETLAYRHASCLAYNTSSPVREATTYVALPRIACMCESQPVCEVLYPYDIMIANLQHANNSLLQNSAVLVGQSKVEKNIRKKTKYL